MMKIQTDDYMLNKKHFDQMKKYGMECDPVDMNGGYVALDKFGTDNLSKTQDSIRERFDLESPFDETQEPLV